MKKGQALVETALLAPVLVFILIGVLEIGWALRGYLVLANANREAARFAVRPGYLDYTDAGYNRVISHTFDAIGSQIYFDCPTSDSCNTIIISAIRVDTQLVCDPEKRNPDSSLDCDCDKAVTDPFSPTLVSTPMTVPTLTYRFPASSTETTLLNYYELAEEAIRENRLFNCKLQLAEARPAIDEMVIVEMIYYQHQLFGFPLISNPLTDPIKMTVHTAMRKIENRGN